MPMLARSRNVITLVLCLIAALSSAQTSGIAPRLVSADNSITIQTLRAPTSTESFSAAATAKVNPDTSQVSIALHQGTPLSVYAVLFVSESINIQIGTLVTDAGGEGALQATLNSGAYVGVFEIMRLGLLQFVSASTSFTIGTSASATVSGTSTAQTLSTTSKTSSETTSSTTVSVSNSEQFVFQVDPATRSINAGDFAKFNIRIAQNNSASIFLVARDVPSGSVA